ncbi:MAG: hypothetical protein ACR2GO_04570, partial [Candidatus Limnocylindria bacterium]
MALIQPLVSSVQASDVDPTHVPGNENKTCGTLVAGLGYEFKIDPFPAYDDNGDEADNVHVYDDPDSALVVTVTVSEDGSFDFETNLAVNAVFVKGGNDGGNLYIYAPPTTSDDGLDTPTSQGISHVSFCFNEAPVA